MASRRLKKARPQGKRNRVGGTGETAAAPARQAEAAQALLVLGMHRSGTSALTRVLSLLGADLPKNILGANPTNEAGHWESLDLINVHDELLLSAASRWDDWRAFNPDWDRSSIAEIYKERLLGVLQNDFGRSPLFVIKDPRICRFASVWLDVLERFGARTRAVIVVRNPLEVVASLKRRDNFPPAKSYLLWLRHTLDAEKATRHMPRGIVTYDRLLDDWRGLVKTVAAKTGLHWPRRSDHSELEIDRFLADALRHHAAGFNQLTARADVADWIKDAYRLLHQMAGRREIKDDFRKLDGIRADFDKACTAFGLVLAGEAEQSQSHLRSIETQIKAQDDAVVENEKRIADLRARLGALNGEADELGRARDELLAALEERKTPVAQGEERALSLERELEIQRTATKEREAAAANLKAELNNAQSISDGRKAEIDRLTGELASARSAIRDRDRELDKLSRDIDATRRALRESQTEIQHLAGERDSARIELERAVVEQQRAFELLKTARDGLSQIAAEVPLVCGDSLGQEFEGSRQESGQKENQIGELFERLQSVIAQFLAQEKARAGELARSAAELHRVEMNAADRVAALDAMHAVTLAESENKAQAQIRLLRDRLIDAEAALAKVKSDTRNGPAWIKRLSKHRAVRQLKNSGLFDTQWYLREYPDVAKSGRAPAEHYLEDGYLSGYRPNQLFDTRWYLERYEDVRRAGVNPLLHYLKFGWREGRDPGLGFQTDYYLAANPDVRSKGVNPLRHYLLHGRHEGRLPTA